MCLYLVLERLIPAVKARDLPVELPSLRGSPAEKAQQIVDAIATGQITPNEGHTLLNALTLQQRVGELEEVERRVEALAAAYRQVRK